MSVKEYSYQSTQLSEYALIVVANSKTRMSKFFFGSIRYVGQRMSNSDVDKTYISQGWLFMLNKSRRKF